jgi:hypothetical protein
MEMLSKNMSTLSIAGGAKSPTFTGEGKNLSVVTVWANDVRATMGDDAAAEVGSKGFCYFITKKAVFLSKEFIPGINEIFVVF